VPAPAIKPNDLAITTPAVARAQSADTSDAPTAKKLPRAPRPTAQPLPDAPQVWFTVHQADARRIEMLLGEFSSRDHPLLTTTITSPPYADLKDYGHADQIGFGQRYDEYLIDVRRVLEGIFHHTRPDGSLWLIADTLRPKLETDGMRRMRLLPFELVHEAERVGWVLRDVVIWVKDKTLPWSSRGRLRNQFEYVFFFVKSRRFKYHVDRLREPDVLRQWWVRYPERYSPQGKAPNNVWAVPIPVQGSWANTQIQHACPLPPDLVERMLLLSTDVNDVVLDPFAGSGVVVAEATRLQRRGVGFELVSEHVTSFHDTVRPEVLERRGADVLVDRLEERMRLQETILALRVVKYPKALFLGARQRNPALPAPSHIIVLRRPARAQRTRPKHALVLADVYVVIPDGVVACRSRLSDELDEVRRCKPASKYGVAGEIQVVTESEAATLGRGQRLYGYAAGRCHLTIGPASPRRLGAFEAMANRHRIPPILSNVRVSERPRALHRDAGTA
jgi:DNA modification methylase